MHDLIIDFDMYKLWLCRYLRIFFGFLVLPFFQNKHKIKNKVGIKTTFFINDENT